MAAAVACWEQGGAWPGKIVPQRDADELERNDLFRARRRHQIRKGDIRRPAPGLEQPDPVIVMELQDAGREKTPPC